MKLRGVIGILFFLLILLPTATFAHHQVVLVTNVDCPVNTISSLELRKIYFGIQVKHKDYLMRGIQNQTNSQLDRIFHQTVVAMSKKSYQRRLLAQSLNRGSPSIAKFTDSIELYRELVKNTCNVTYMWEDQVRKYYDLKIIKLLWQKN
mgnify:CR=1 FL=1